MLLFNGNRDALAAIYEYIIIIWNVLRFEWKSVVVEKIKRKKTRNIVYTN